MVDFIDPLLTEAVSGATWNPTTLAWVRTEN
jgi:hypothetical protein